MARRRNSNRRHRRGSFRFLYKLLSIVVICAAVILALTLFFRVDTVEVTGQHRYSAEEIREATGISIGDNLYLLNKYDAVNRLQAALPYIEEVRINRRLPDTLTIEVTECAFTFALCQEGTVWYISPSGRIVEQGTIPVDPEVPAIDGCTLLSPSVGTPLALATEYASQQQSLLELMAALEDADLLEKADAIHLGDLDILTMDYDGRFAVEMRYGADYAQKLRTLEAVIEKLESNETGTIRLTRDDGKVNVIRG